MSAAQKLGLFQGYGIELEYMIVCGENLSVLPVADRLLCALAGEIVPEVDAGPLCWSNELALHAIEMKTNGPVSSLHGLAGIFQEHVARANGLLGSLGGLLMPTGMHPWMDPSRETRLWPHGYGHIYRTFDRIFGCRAHGWANLQSIHLNLPFHGDDEFGRLHAATRLVLPIIPAIAASSPVMDGRATGFLDNRLEVYRRNQKVIPSITGRVIPEAVYTQRTYRKRILEPIYRDIAAHDPEGVLRHEWINSRGAIVRFDRGTLEIRISDMQECPGADIAVAAAIIGVLMTHVAERWISLGEQKAWEVEPLRKILWETIRYGDEAVITDRDYLRAFGFPGERAAALELWQYLAGEESVANSVANVSPSEYLRTILRHGPLARRILKTLGKDSGRAAIAAVYRSLCEHLSRGEMFAV